MRCATLRCHEDATVELVRSDAQDSRGHTVSPAQAEFFCARDAAEAARQAREQGRRVRARLVFHGLPLDLDMARLFALVRA